MLVAVAFFTVVMMVVLVVVMMTADGAGSFCLQTCKLGLKGICLFHCGKNLRTRQLFPIGGDDDGVLIICAYGLDGGVQLFGGKPLNVAENYGACTRQLVAEELTEVAQMHQTFCRICNGNKSCNFQPVRGGLAYGADDVG